MQMLVYLCATNFSIVRVINGRGRGGPKSDIYKIPKKLIEKLTSEDVFLDDATGDFYCYDLHRKEFFPVANTGLHSHKAA